MQAYSHIDIDLLRCFVEVTAQRNFTAAAERLYRTQSAVSMSIKRLETLAGRQLLVRNSRGLHLTPAGEVLLGYARQVTQAHQQMQAWLQGPALAGQLTVGIAEHVAQVHLARVLAAFRRHFPQVAVLLEVGPSEGLLHKLKQRRLDVVIAQPYEGHQPDLVLQREDLVWVAGRHYPLDLSAPLPLALLPPPCHYGVQGRKALEQAALAYEVVITCTSLAGIQNLVGGNLAVSVLTRSSVTPELQVLGPKTGLPRLPLIETGVFRPATDQNALVEPFVAFLTDQFGASPAISPDIGPA